MVNKVPLRHNRKTGKMDKRRMGGDIERYRGEWLKTVLYEVALIDNILSLKKFIRYIEKGIPPHQWITRHVDSFQFATLMRCLKNVTAIYNKYIK
jgi:hypothetical protein